MNFNMRCHTTERGTLKVLDLPPNNPNWKGVGSKPPTVTKINLHYPKNIFQSTLETLSRLKVQFLWLGEGEEDR